MFEGLEKSNLRIFSAEPKSNMRPFLKLDGKLGLQRLLIDLCQSLHNG